MRSTTRNGPSRVSMSRSKDSTGGAPESRRQPANAFQHIGDACRSAAHRRSATRQGIAQLGREIECFARVSNAWRHAHPCHRAALQAAAQASNRSRRHSRAAAQSRCAVRSVTPSVRGHPRPRSVRRSSALPTCAMRACTDSSRSTLHSAHRDRAIGTRQLQHSVNRRANRRRGFCEFAARARSTRICRIMRAEHEQARDSRIGARTAEHAQQGLVHQRRGLQRGVAAAAQHVAARRRRSRR